MKEVIYFSNVVKFGFSDNKLLVITSICRNCTYEVFVATWTSITSFIYFAVVFLHLISDINMTQIHSSFKVRLLSKAAYESYFCNINVD